jgi:7-carboxy-7-deazaguanine synthase
MDPADVARRLLDFGVGLIVVSGGEPLNQQSRLGPALVAAGIRFNVSPKLAHSGIAEKRRIVPEVLREFTRLPGTAFKFVCATAADLEEVDALVARHSLKNIWIMPRGQSPEEIDEGIRRLADDVVGRRWNLSGRLHVTIWGSKRGV